jgi:hypothetical protein
MTIPRILMIALLVSSSAWPGRGQTRDYWLIKGTRGSWEYRMGTKEPRPITGRYDYLEPAGEVRCMEKDVRLCELRYLIDPRSDKTEKLPIGPLKTAVWTSLKKLPVPPQPVLSMTSADLVAKFKRVTQVGGSRDSSACGGNFALKAPVCGENADIFDFRIRWTPSADDADKKISILVETVDGTPVLFRDTAPAAKGEYADDKLLDYLKKRQGRNNPVDLTVTIVADGGRQAVRLIHILPSVRTERYQLRLSEIESDDPFIKTLARMALAMDEEMWSKAAEEACRLMEMTAGASELQEFALAGLCQSDFEEEKSRLRSELPKEKSEAICNLSAAARPEPEPEKAVAPQPSAPTKGKMRLGIALVIGNSDYWNQPLNSVKADIKNMSEALEALGFQVTSRENLSNPKQFQDALEEVLKKEKASPEDILLVYYSGHGLQLDGKAHLLGTGVSSTARRAEDVRANAQSAEGMLAQMERAAPQTRILIVEACRNNVFASSSDPSGQSPRSGFAFQQDDVPNTVVMFANKPGFPTPARSDYGLMGPFTDSLIYALPNSSGEIKEVFELAAKKTAEISPGQEPMLYASKKLDPIIMRPHEGKLLANRAKDLLNDAGIKYQSKAWDEFLITVERARVLASDDPELQIRLDQELKFVRLVTEAQKAQEAHNWKEAAAPWQRAGELFPARQWVTMNAAVAWLMADDLSAATLCLAVLSAQSEGELARQAKQILQEILTSFPDLEAAARKKAQETPKVTAIEFELIKDKE